MSKTKQSKTSGAAATGEWPPRPAQAANTPQGAEPAGSPLKQLGAAGQAVWLDFLSRELLVKGGLHKLVQEDGLTGLTSNPSIFEKAMGHGSDYDDYLGEFLAQGDAEPGQVYEHLAIRDIQEAADILRPVYDRLDGRDGYVSMEVSPHLAFDTQGTIEEARRLWQAVDRPNLMIKVPGTEAGVPAIAKLIQEGINVNITLLFARHAFHLVADAYLWGLEQRVKAGKDISRLASVASFFVSRIDTQIDGKIDERLKTAKGKEAEALKALRGKVAIANAKAAYQDYLLMIASPRWQALAKKGARVQRLLWASTGTKDPAYPKTLYVDTLIGADTVNTMPPATMDAFRESGQVSVTLTNDIADAQKVLDEAKRLKLDLDGVTAHLVEEGARQFADAFDALLGAVGAKRVALLRKKLNAVQYTLPGPLQEQVDAVLERARKEGWARRLWRGDATMWTNQDENRWVAWLAAGEGKQVDLEQLKSFMDGVQKDGFTDAVLLGMGGSSLGPDVLAHTLGTTGKGIALHVLDSTNPEQIANIERQIDLARTLFIVSSKSGSTLEPEILCAHFFAAAAAQLGQEKAARHFVAVTDPGSKLEALAKKAGYRAVFHGDPGIGGRYSVLSVFGMVPLAVLGHDVGAFFDKMQIMVRSCGASAPPAINPGVYLGAILGAGAVSGRDKCTIVASPAIHTVGAWLEQLLAESTGKQGKGIIPVDLEPLGKPGVYGNDRVFAYLRRDGDDTRDLDARVDALAKAGHPVVRIEVKDDDAIGQEFFRWEIATAVAGAVIGIDPFDQPDVEASKIKTRALTDAFEKSGDLGAETAFGQDGDLVFYGDASLKDDTLEGVLRKHLARIQPGDYAGFLAYICRDDANAAPITMLRVAVRDALKVATVAGFGPRFLHSTGQAYKGGPNSGVFLQITADPARDMPIPGRRITFGKVQAAQARGDLEVLAERGRRYLRIHIQRGDITAALQHIAQAAAKALA
jgi:transaldolase/glucose-6-phosphate isomerase